MCALVKSVAMPSPFRFRGNGVLQFS